MTGSSDELTDFVRRALERGVERPRIEAALLDAGWPREKVAPALRAFAEIDFPLPVPRPQPYLSARDAFLYLLLFTALFLSAFNVGSILFELIEKAVPDPAGSRFSASSLRWSVAFVVVAFPLYLFLTVRQGRELRRDPARRASKVRKWLTYLTLFVAAGFLVGDLVALVFNLLEGELTLRFLLKVAVVAAIAGTAGGWYLRDLRRDEEAEA
jgi:hypothetical protein